MGRGAGRGKDLGLGAGNNVGALKCGAGHTIGGLGTIEELDE